MNVPTSGRSIVFVDANTIWHRRVAEALGTVRPTIAFLPHNDVRLRSNPISEPRHGASAFAAVGLPPGWASRTMLPAAEILAARVRAAAQRLADPVVVLPSPAYAALAWRLHGRYPLIYYGADDYRSYAGWPAAKRRERAIVRRAHLAAFVSESLAERAIAEGCAPDRVVVSPNATEPRFGPAGKGLSPPALTGRAGPVVGILGALSERLDIEFVRRVAALPAVGTLLVAGSVDPILETTAPWLRDPKILVTGRVPHEEMHMWAHAMDAALIPYAATELNRHCSPMRLWDHLATGAPIFALSTCEQIVRLDDPGVTVGSNDMLLSALSRAHYSRIVRRPQLWRNRAEELVDAIEMAAPSNRSR